MFSCFLPYINVISYRCTYVPSLLNLPSTFHPIPLLQVVTEHQVELPVSGSKFHQAPLSMTFSRQEYWSGLPFPSPGDLPNPGIKPWSPAWEADSLPSEPAGKPPPGMGKPLHPVSLINRFATWQRLDFSIFLVHTCPESLFSTPLKQESCTSTNLATLFFPPWMSIPVVRCL